ncbi:TetR/AcrR family transcriptional regulator [Mycobacterium sp. 1274761.0]|uniref:TetR/AcrR family transcriptional regulator n=1 Tax=Mycobacterium sp. 1274761.0 TaxID=1834077 RepID=UPI00080204E4|nr:TetR/AcrR family transcriptional regulator [Mycobacterium sp. 1274761.0]OBK80115.1 TetR family transcriptional regulator [Mycobacterium sp. 1274761.0]
MAAERPLRADAARNAARVLRAAREVYAELGPDAPMEVIASRAGIAERTLYRRFPNKGELARAVVDRSVAETLSPVIDRAHRCRNPLRGMATLLEAAIELGARDHNALLAARRAGSLAGVSTQLDDALEELACRAQEAGLVRADLKSEDLPRIVAMLYSVLGTMDPSTDGWRRYLALMLDAISTPNPSRLPRAVAILYPRPQDWPM